MAIGIYGIFDAVTDECLYVGLSRTIEARWKGHIKDLKGERHKQGDFVLWFKEHDKNVNSMNFRILEECEPEDKILNSLEFKWTKTLIPRFAGKIPSDNEKWTHTEETKKRISVSLTKTSGRLIDRDIQCPYCAEYFQSIRRNAVYCSLKCSGDKKFEDLAKYDEEIVNLYQSGLSLREVVEVIDFDVSHVTLRKRFITLGVSLRSNRKEA